MNRVGLMFLCMSLALAFIAGTVIQGANAASGSPCRDVQQFAKVMPRGFKTTVDLNGESFEPEDVIAFKIANVGSVAVSYGEETRVDVFDGAGWIPASAFPPIRVEKRVGRLDPGETGMCEQLKIPSTTPAGKYRIEKQVRPIFGKHWRRITATFRVT